MRGERLAAAKEAAISYVNGLPDDVEVGLVSFNDTVTVDVRPTTRQGGRHQRHQRLRPADDGAVGRHDHAGSTWPNPTLGARLLVLSDGGDTVSGATAEDVTSRAAAEGIPIDIVALTPTVSPRAGAANRVPAPAAASSCWPRMWTALRKAFDEATGSFGGKVAVTATVPAGGRGERQVRRS